MHASDKVIIYLDIHKGDIIGDIFTGRGYFTFEFLKIFWKNQSRLCC